MQRAGVTTMASTDTWWLYGFSMHDELAELVKAGVTPMEALHAATSIPAEDLGGLDSMGTVEKGRRADLVLLDANPLDRIENTRRIRAVVANGRLLDRPALDRLLAQVEAAASHNARGTN